MIAYPGSRGHKQRRLSCRLLIAYKNLLRASEHVSISMVFGLHYFGMGALPARCFSRWARHDALSIAHLQSAKLFSPGLERRLDSFNADNGNLAADIIRWSVSGASGAARVNAVHSRIVRPPRPAPRAQARTASNHAPLPRWLY